MLIACNMASYASGCCNDSTTVLQGNDGPRKPGGNDGDTPIKRTPAVYPLVYASLSNGLLTIDVGNLAGCEVTFYVSDDNEVPVLTDQFVGGTSYAFDVSDWPSGIYFIALETETLYYEGEFEIE